MSYFWAEPWFQVSLLAIAAVASVIVVVWYRQDRKEIRERHDALKAHLDEKLTKFLERIDQSPDMTSIDEAIGQAEQRLGVKIDEQSEGLDQHLNDSGVILEALASSAEQMAEIMPILYQRMEDLPAHLKQSMAGLMGKAQQMMNGEEEKIYAGLDAMFDDELGNAIMAKYPVIGRRLVQEMKDRPQYAPYVRDWAVKQGLLTAEAIPGPNGTRQNSSTSKSNGDISSYYN